MTSCWWLKIAHNGIIYSTEIVNPTNQSFPLPTTQPVAKYLPEHTLRRNDIKKAE
jgi:hypothetical protein